MTHEAHFYVDKHFAGDHNMQEEPADNLHRWFRQLTVDQKFVPTAWTHDPAHKLGIGTVQVFDVDGDIVVRESQVDPENLELRKETLYFGQKIADQLTEQGLGDRVKDLNPKPKQ